MGDALELGLLLGVAAQSRRRSNEWVYWVWVYENSCSGQAVNFTNPAQVVTTPGQPGMVSTQTPPPA